MVTGLDPHRNNGAFFLVIIDAGCVQRLRPGTFVKRARLVDKLRCPARGRCLGGQRHINRWAEDACGAEKLRV